MSPQPASARRPDLDALRVFAFAMLILYHTGMGYVTWGWHVVSAYAGPAPELAMSLMSPWRLPLLFFISGVAMACLAAKLGAARFAAERVWRLFVPLVFGMAVIIAPQTYFELRQSGEIEAGYIDFWGRYLSFADPFSVTTPTWNHLWYVAYIFVYALILAPVLPLLRRLDALRAGRVWTGAAGAALLLVLPVLPLIVWRIALVPHFPTTHDLVQDWANHAVSLTFVIYGVLAARSEAFWSAVDRAGPWALGLALVLGAGLAAAWWDMDAFFADPARAWTARIARMAYAWVVIVALMWGARRLVVRSGPVLKRLNTLIFPIFIFHQTITVTAIYLITANAIALGGPAEFALVAAVTLVGSWALAEAAWRVPVLRPLVGMKFADPAHEKARPGADGRGGLVQKGGPA
jgi:glucans biosynthesis protein C